MRMVFVFGILAVVLILVLATKEKPAWPDEPLAAAPVTAPEAASAPASAQPPAALTRRGREPWSPGAFEWLSPAIEASPGFVDPNRLDPRTPTGDPLLYRALPLGPRLAPPGSEASTRW